MDLLWVPGVDVVGAGYVEKSTVVSILILVLGKNYLMLKIIITRSVAKRRVDFLKKRTVKEGIILIVEEDGTAE
jgi:hypothetical protein